MAGSVETMCAGCANQDPKDGGCKLAWVSKQNQIERAAASYCEDAQVFDGNGEAQNAPAIIIPESWTRIFKKR